MSSTEDLFRQALALLGTSGALSPSGCSRRSTLTRPRSHRRSAPAVPLPDQERAALLEIERKHPGVVATEDVLAVIPKAGP